MTDISKRQGGVDSLITPAMISAGVRFLRETYEVSSSEEVAAQMAQSLFSEMMEAAPKPLRRSRSR